MENTFKKKTILNHSKFLKVKSHQIQLPDGKIIPDWPWVILHGAALVLAQREDGKFLVFHQTKYAVDGTTLAPVAGCLNPTKTHSKPQNENFLNNTFAIYVDENSFLVE